MDLTKALIVLFSLCFIFFIILIVAEIQKIRKRIVVIDGYGWERTVYVLDVRTVKNIYKRPLPSPTLKSRGFIVVFYKTTTYYKYNIDEWTVVDILKTKDNTKDRIWPECDLPIDIDNPKLGDRKQGNRREDLWLTYRNGCEVMPITEEIWQSDKFKIGAEFTYTKNKGFIDFK